MLKPNLEGIHHNTHFFKNKDEAIMLKQFIKGYLTPTYVYKLENNADSQAKNISNQNKGPSLLSG